MNKIILLLSTIIVVFLVGCQTVEIIEKSDEKVDKSKVGFAGISKQQCQEADGFWDECGSPCAGTDADFCIQVCQVQCGCGGIAGYSCPEGFKCRLTGKIADEGGVLYY